MRLIGTGLEVLEDSNSSSTEDNDDYSEETDGYYIYTI